MFKEQVPELNISLKSAIHQLSPIEKDIFRFLEIGVAQGHTTYRTVEELKNFRGGNFEVHCCDPFKSYWEKQSRDEEKTYKEFLELNSSNIEEGFLFFGREPSSKFLTDLAHNGKAESFHIVYVDGAHDALSVMRDFILSDILLKPGGVIIFDDYTWISRAEREYVDKQNGIRHPCHSPAASIDFIKNTLTNSYEFLLDNGTTPVFIKR